MKHCTYNTRGTCSRLIEFDIDSEGLIHNVFFLGGCAGNTMGVSRLVEGMDAREAAQRLRGIPCGSKGTSCPDQLAHAILENL